MLANLVLRTEIVERMLIKQDFKMVQAEIIDLKGQVRSSLEEMRKVIFNLRPMALDDLGLIPTLRKYVQDFEVKQKFARFLKQEARNTAYLLQWRLQSIVSCRRVCPMLQSMLIPLML